MSPTEQVKVANIARYHRGAAPKKRHRNYGALEKSIRRRIKRLAAILRVADGLDRGHSGAARRLKVRWLPTALRVTPIAEPETHPMRLEIWGAHRKSGLLADIIGVPVEIVSPDGTVLSSDALEGGEREE